MDRTDRGPGVANPVQGPRRRKWSSPRRVRAALAAALGACAIGWVVPTGEQGGNVTPPGEASGLPVAAASGRVEVVWSHASAEPAAAGPAPPRAAAPPSGNAHSQAYRDPETGRWTAPPPEVVEGHGPQRLSAATSTTAEGLTEESLEGPRGGVRVNLRGRFRSALVADRDPAGRVQVGCGVSPGAIPAADEAGEPRTISAGQETSARGGR